jgi:hypothetical protein
MIVTYERSSLPEVRDAQGRDLYLLDGWHLTSAGHDYVAGRLVDTVNMWLQGKEALLKRSVVL